MDKFGKAVVAIIENNGNILIGKKQQDSTDPLTNTWHIPGGKNKNGESDEEALRREMMEELGVLIRIERLLDESIQLRKETTFHVAWYLCHLDPENQEIVSGSDLKEARFVAKKDTFLICSEKASSLWPKKVREYLNPE